MADIYKIELLYTTRHVYTYVSTKTSLKNEFSCFSKVFSYLSMDMLHETDSNVLESK